MTANDNVAIESLRQELHEYHVDVQRLIQRCESCRANVECLTADIYGLPGNKEANPGLMGEVADLRRSRRTMLLAVRGAWALLTALAGAVGTALAKKLL
ncbi:MAG: hypothetical protein ABFC63_09625 [Thermoguttaceae bacterium]